MALLDPMNIMKPLSFVEKMKEQIEFMEDCDCCSLVVITDRGTTNIKVARNALSSERIADHNRGKPLGSKRNKKIGLTKERN